MTGVSNRYFMIEYGVSEDVDEETYVEKINERTHKYKGTPTITSCDIIREDKRTVVFLAFNPKLASRNANKIFNLNNNNSSLGGKKGEVKITTFTSNSHMEDMFHQVNGDYENPYKEELTICQEQIEKMKVEMNDMKLKIEDFNVKETLYVGQIRKLEEEKIENTREKDGLYAKIANLNEQIVKLEILHVRDK